MSTISNGKGPRRQKGTGKIELKRPGVYKVTVGRGTTKDGSQRYRSETVHGTRAEAEARAAEIYDEMSANEQGLTLAAYYKRHFLPSKMDTTQANRNGYAKMWGHLPEKWKTSELSEPPHAEIQAWVNGLTPGTAKSSYKYFRAVLRAAYTDKLLASEPCTAKVRYPRGEAMDDTTRAVQTACVWDEAETVAAWLLVRGERLEAYVLLASSTGMRREEALPLDWSDIDFSVTRRGIAHDVTAWVNIERALTEEDGVKGTKNTHSRRRVPICGYAARRLYDLRRESGPIAATLDGRPLKVSGFRRQWQNLWKEAHEARYSRSTETREFPAGPLAGLVSEVKPNSLRHANITLMDELGVDARTNRRYHGHKQRDVQGAHYIKRFDMQLLKAAQAVADAYDSAAEFAMTTILGWDVDTSIF